MTTQGRVATFLLLSTALTLSSFGCSSSDGDVIFVAVGQQGRGTYQVTFDDLTVLDSTLSPAWNADQVTSLFQRASSAEACERDGRAGICLSTNDGGPIAVGIRAAPNRQPLADLDEFLLRTDDARRCTENAFDSTRLDCANITAGDELVVEIRFAEVSDALTVAVAVESSASFVEASVVGQTPLRAEPASPRQDGGGKRGARVEFRGEAGTGEVFTGWTGDCRGQPLQFARLLDRNLNCIARFRPADLSQSQLCGVDQRVSGGSCVSCPDGATNDAGDDPAGTDTSCDLPACEADERVRNSQCESCQTGESNAAGDIPAGPDTECDGTTRCPSDQRVNGGVCVSCPPGEINDAGDDPAGPNTTCDIASGGGTNDCPQTCAANEICQNGQCVDACAPPFSLCDGRCVNLDEDPKYCGSCANECARNETCEGGLCTCPNPLSQCTNGCVDTSTAVSDCGDCNQACTEPGEVCTDGICGCPAGETACPIGGCADLDSDNFNCGLCGRVCNNEDVCVDGACVDPITCQANAQPPASCTLFPVDVEACGLPVASTPFSSTSTTLASRDFRIAIPEVAPNQRVYGELTYFNSGSGGGVSQNFRNSLDEPFQLSSGNFIVATNSSDVREHVYPGQRTSCASASQFFINALGMTVSGDFSIETLSGNFNTGGLDVRSATPLPDAACTLQCGYSSGTCGETAHFYEITLPARGWVDIELLTRTPSASGYSIWAFAGPSRNLICTFNGITQREWTPLLRRYINNLNEPQTIAIRVDVGQGEFRMAIATSAP